MSNKKLEKAMLDIATKSYDTGMVDFRNIFVEYLKENAKAKFISISELITHLENIKFPLEAEEDV